MGEESAAGGRVYLCAAFINGTCASRPDWHGRVEEGQMIRFGDGDVQRRLRW